LSKPNQGRKSVPKFTFFTQKRKDLAYIHVPFLFILVSFLLEITFVY